MRENQISDGFWRFGRGCGTLAALTLLSFGCAKSGAGAPEAGQALEIGSGRPLKPGIGQTDAAYRPRGLSTKVFTDGGFVYAPMDMQSQSTRLKFDVASRTVVGHASIVFRQPTTSRPVLLLDGTLNSIQVNGEPTAFRRLGDPTGAVTLVGIDHDILPDDTAQVEIDFELPAERFSFTNGGAGFLVDNADLAGHFFERFSPMGFEDDAFSFTLDLEVTGAAMPFKQQLFANGVTSVEGPNVWRVKFPSHFTMSSFFVHFTNRPLEIKQFTIASVTGRQIPITVYSSLSRNASQAAKSLPNLFSEIERDYGPYPHEQFIAYIGQSSGGMEYVGATITSLRSLSHELFHSWFARGVMPADGRSGWIDEAIASWRDNGSSRADTLLSRPPTNLGGGSEFRRSTPRNSYVDGRALIAELDLLFANAGGMKTLLRDFAERYRYSVVTTEELRWFLESRGQQDLERFFARYVYGGTVTRPGLEVPRGVLHPTTLTEAELTHLR